MRKLVLTLAVASVLAVSFPVFAQRMGSPAPVTDTGSWALSLQWEYWDRDMHFSALSDDLSTNANMYMARWDYGVTDFLELNFKLGAGEADIQHRLRFNGDTQFAAGGGVKALVYQEGDLTVSGLAEAAYFRSNGHIGGFSADVGLFQIDAGVGAAYQVDRFTPYGGVVLSYVDGDVDGIVGYNAESDVPWGIFLGLDYLWREDVAGGGDLSVGSEVQLYGDGWGLSLIVSYRM